MKTNHFFRLLLLFLALAPVALAAQPQDKKDRIETMHIAYISQRLNLTPAEAEKFWPIYNEYKAEQDKLRKEHTDNIQAVKKAGGIDSISDAEARKLIDNEIDFETRELALRKEYVEKFQQAIPLRKVAKFFIAEDEFKRYLLNKLKHHGPPPGRDDDERGPN